MTKSMIKYAFLLYIGGKIYTDIEWVFRGYSHWSMAILGGLCFVLTGLINNRYSWRMPLWKQMLIASFIITAAEFVFGLILNVWLGWGIWDYSHMSVELSSGYVIPFNILGQICLPFTILWFFLSIVAIVLDDYLRFWFFGEQKPEYILFTKRKDKGL